MSVKIGDDFMVTDQQKTALEQLDAVIEQFVTHIDDFKKNPSDFTLR